MQCAQKHVNCSINIIYNTNIHNNKVIIINRIRKYTFVFKIVMFSFLGTATPGFGFGAIPATNAAPASIAAPAGFNLTGTNTTPSTGTVHVCKKSLIMSSRNKFDEQNVMKQGPHH